jgi:hypothetical protein
MRAVEALAMLAVLWPSLAAAEDSSWASPAEGIVTGFQKEHAAQVQGLADRSRTTESAAQPTEVRLSDPWTDETRQRVYQLSGPPSPVLKAIGDVLYESPVPDDPVFSPMMDPFPDDQAQQIADACRASFVQLWDKIGCVSRAVHSHFVGHKFTGSTSFCRSHAMAFEKSFNALGIEHTWAAKREAEGAKVKEAHVVNDITVTSANGTVYSYVIDSGWYPGVLFPLNDAAVAFHSRTHPGHTDFRQFPAISPHPSAAYRAAP